MRVLLTMIMISLLASSATAVGLGPVQVFKAHKPGATEKITLYVFNNEEKNLVLDVTVDGELAEYLEYNSTISLPANQEKAELYFILTHPDVLKEGAHLTDLIITETQVPDAMVVALQRHASTLRVQVPTQDIYAEAVMKITTGANDATFDIDVFNYGAWDVSAVADITVTESGKVKSLRTDSISIPSLEQRTISAHSELEPGRYQARAIVDYGRQIELTEDFIVGEREIIILGVRPEQPAYLGDVVPIDIVLSSLWHEPLEASIEMLIMKDAEQNAKLADDIVVLGERTYTLNWDTEGFEPGSYEAHVTLFYEDQIKTAQSSIYLSPADERPFPWLWILLIIVLIATLLLITYPRIKKFVKDVEGFLYG